MDRDLALYVHWPFCNTKCPYCDFNSYARADVDHARWRAAYLRELSHFAAATAGRRLVSVYFGGGTPSRMAPATVAAVLEFAIAAWPTRGDVEITLEANPNASDAGRFRAFREAGINRLSLGVQSFDEAALAFLGRSHDSAQARTALAAARETFPRVSFDLIYALPGQTKEEWRRELATALGHAPDHLSVYQLTIEPGTRFERAGVAAADEDAGAELYAATQEILSAAGLPAYEVSNHARAGQESRHNLVYWRGGDYLGVGPGAHGRLTSDGRTRASRQIDGPTAWLKAVEADGHGTAEATPLSAAERREELVMTGLRLTTGIERALFRARAGCEIEAAVSEDGLGILVEEGFVVADAAGLRTTAEGRLRLDAVLARLLAD